MLETLMPGMTPVLPVKGSWQASVTEGSMALELAARPAEPLLVAEAEDGATLMSAVVRRVPCSLRRKAPHMMRVSLCSDFRSSAVSISWLNQAYKESISYAMSPKCSPKISLRRYIRNSLDHYQGLRVATSYKNLYRQPAPDQDL